MPEFKKSSDHQSKKGNQPALGQGRSQTEQRNQPAALSEESGEVRDDDDDQLLSGEPGGEADDLDDEEDTLMLGNNKIDAGLDCSDIEYFNIMKSGGRVTRNSIRKEKQPTASNLQQKPTNKNLTPSQLMRAKQDAIQEKLQKEKDLKKGKKILTKGGQNLNTYQQKLSNLKQFQNKPLDQIESFQMKNQQQKQKQRALRKTETSDVEMTNEKAEPTRISAISPLQGQSSRVGASADKDQAMKTVASSSNQAKDVPLQSEKIPQKSGSNQSKGAQPKAVDSKQPKKRDEKAAQKQIAVKPAGVPLSASPLKQDKPPQTPEKDFHAQLALMRKQAKEQVKQRGQSGQTSQAQNKATTQEKEEKIHPEAAILTPAIESSVPLTQEGKPKSSKTSESPPKKVEKQIIAEPAKAKIVKELAPKKDQVELQQLQRHLELIEKFEQHFPHCQFVKNRLIVYGESYAEIGQCVGSTQSANGMPSDYEKLQAQVKIDPDIPPVPMKMKVFKYLSRVYHCDSSFVKMDELSDEVQENLQAKKKGSILVVQVIDNSNKYTGDREKYSSAYPVQFYAMGQDEFEERLILSGPIQFKSEIDVLTDLNIYDPESSIQFAYKDNFINYIQKEAKKINQRFSEYRDKASKIYLDEKNVFQSLFTLCTFDNNDNQRRKGVLMQVKYDQLQKNYMLLIRHIQMKQSQKEKFEWVGLSHASRTGQNQDNQATYHVLSDQYRGFVSLDYFKSLDNAYLTGVKLRSKYLTFISHEASLVQTSKSLHLMVFKKPLEFGDVIDLATLEDDSKVSNVVSKSAVRSEYSYHSNNQVQQKYLQQQGHKSCKKCNYKKEGISILTCSECRDAWHVQCLDDGDYQQKLGMVEKLWRCPSCIRCTNCRSMVGNKQLMLLCRCCNSPFHYDCLDQTTKNQIPQFVVDFETKLMKNKVNAGTQEQLAVAGQDLLKDLIQVDFKCHTCIKCVSCGVKEAGKTKLHKWSKDFNFCSRCNKMRKAKQYCQICNEMWHSENIDELMIEGPNQMINCARCQMSSHVRCDLILLDLEIKDRMMQGQQFAGESTFYKYHCSECRRSNRLAIISQVISELESEDKNNYYQDEFWLESEQFSAAQSKQYLRQVKNPICFAILKRRISQYLQFPENLKQDCLQIFLNAKNYYRPNTQIYRDAEKMHSICLDKVNAYLPHLDRQRIAQDHESMYKRLVETQSGFQIKVGRRPETEADMLELKAFETESLPKLIQTMYDAVFIPEEHANQHQKLQFPSRSPFPSPIPLPSLGLNASNQAHGLTAQDQNLSQDHPARQTNRRGVKRVDYQENALAANYSGSQRAFFDKSAPSELVEKQELSSPEIFRADGAITHYDEGGIKRQKIVDQHEQIGNNISMMLDAQKNLDQLSQQGLAGSMSLVGAVPQGQNSKSTTKLDKYSTHSAAGTTSIFNPNNLKDKSRKKMMEHYQREDDEGCYYSNAIRCSFDDPRLIFEEMCYLCGSFGNQCDFVTCTLCAESFHTYCLQLTSNDIQDMFQSNWKCLNCKSCEVCGKATDEDLLMFCGTCDRPYHSFCLTPEIKHIPEQWKCEHCFKCRSCGTHEFYNERDIKYGVNIQNSDYSLSKNFSLCYECGQNEFKKLSCHVCHEKTTPELNRRHETLKCLCCGNYSHVACSRVTLSQLKSLLVEVNSKIIEPEKKLRSLESVYTCFECLVSDKSINFLILESCLHYENIHQIIQRQKLLGDICVEVLANYFPLKYRDKVPIFMTKFIVQNQEFFKHDEAILEWLELMQTEVYFEPNDYNMEYIQMKNDDEQDKLTVSENIDDVIQAEADKEIAIHLEMEKRKTLADDSHWKSYNPFSPSQFHTRNAIQSKPGMQLTSIQKINMKMNNYKQGFLPEKRSFYESLHGGTLNTFSQRANFIDPKAIQEELYPTEAKQKQLVDMLVNGDCSESESGAAVPSHDEKYVQNELKAVMRIKMQFFKWFEEFFTSTMDIFQGNTSETQAKGIIQAAEPDIDLEEDRFEHESSKNSSSSESVVSCSEDAEVDNPQANLVCLLCKQKGEFTVTGRLIPYKLNMYVHTSCALWTNEVFDIDDGQIINFYQQQKKLIHQKCSICSELGATLSCARTKGCNKHFHFPCAYRSGKVKFTKMKDVFCEACNKTRQTAQGVIGGHGSNNYHHNQTAADGPEDLNTRIFPTDYMKKKRLYIVRNLEEINQQEYDNEDMELDQPKGNQGGKGNKQGSKDKDTHHSHSGSPKKKGDKDKDLAVNQALSTHSVHSKEIEVDKWRPFYFDLFNRVGNLTVLSLRKEVNQLIDIIQKDNNASGISSIQAYIQQQQQLFNQSGASDQYSQGRNSSGRFLSANNSGNLMEDLKKYLDIFSDYATIRVYWKFYGDKRMQVAANGNSDPRNLQRAYFLYINKTKQIIELEKGDIKTVMEYCSKQIRSNSIVQANVSQQQRLLADTNVINPQNSVAQDYFWKRILDHFKGQRSNFSLQNIEFCVEKLFGQAKYPINVWNQLELTNNDLKYNLNTQKSKLNFFLKSAISILNATAMSSSGYSYPYNLAGNAGTSHHGAGSAAVNKRDQLAQAESNNTNVLMGRVITLDGVFQRMVKVNNMERNEFDRMLASSPYGYTCNSGAGSIFTNNNQRMNQLDQLSINQMGTKHMDYNQMCIALGRGRKVDINEMFKRKAKPNSYEFNDNNETKNYDKQKKLRKQAIDSKKQQQQNTEHRNESTSKVNVNMLSQAMQYRSYVQNPKKVEVGPSKIHRIGLFTQENLKPKDIVIEYVGEILRNQVTDQREKRYGDKGIGDCYMFRLDEQYVIDATFFGGKARYLNHSCDANCYAKVYRVNEKEKHIIIRAAKHIEAGEELTYNYHFDQEEDKLSCFCGSQKCLGNLN